MGIFSDFYNLGPGHLVSVLHINLSIFLGQQDQFYMMAKWVL